LEAFIPDFAVRGDQIVARSQEPVNPAIQVVVNSKKSGQAAAWIFPRYPEFAQPAESPYTFQFRDAKMGYFTGLQVSYEPGQWAVWGGVILMAVGLAMAFYFTPMRFWAVPVDDARGHVVLWVGASASKNRDEFQERFRRLTGAISKELDAKPAQRAARMAISTAVHRNTVREREAWDA
jgi:cytochrome c biogenesis protein